MMVRDRRQPLLAMFASAAVLAGCASPVPEGWPTDLPLMPPTGTITSREFVRLFAENCVRSFPDDRAMARAFLDDGFAENEYTQGRGAYGQWYLEQEADGLGVQIGTVVIVEKRALNFAGDGLGSFYACTLIGDVSDPATFDAEVLAMVDASGRPLAWQADGEGFNVRMERRGTMATLNADPPSLASTGGTPENLPTSCGGLVRCQIWGRAQMHIWLPADFSAAQQ